MTTHEFILYWSGEDQSFIAESLSSLDAPLMARLDKKRLPTLTS